MKKNVTRPRRDGRPNWRPRLLSQAIAIATAGLQASGAFAACPGTQSTLRTITCDLNGGESVTITTTGAILVPGDDAIDISASNQLVTVDNAGIVHGFGAGIYGNFGEGGTIDVVNANDAVILGIYQGIYVQSGNTFNLTNAGVVAAAAPSSSASVAGMRVFGTVGAISNAGVIRANADGGFFDGAEGIEAGSLGAGSTIGNSGTISAEASAEAFAGAVGINVNGSVAGSIANSFGDIVALATASESSAYANGIRIGGNLDGTISNSGSISATAGATDSASAAGIRVSGSTSGAVSNSGTISAAASAFEATAFGIALFDSLYGEGSVTNTGAVDAAASAFDAEATGIFAGNGVWNGATIDNAVVRDAFGNIIATGQISAEADGVFARASGILVETTIDAASSVSNEGVVSASASASAAAQARGIALDQVIGPDGAEGAITNSGSIVASADAGALATATGIYLGAGLATGGSITTSGSILADAGASESAAAYGIRVGGDVAGALTVSSGTITATADANIEAEAVGIWVNGAIVGPEPTMMPLLVGVDGSVSNNGSIAATAGSSENGLDLAYATGIRVDGSVNVGASLSNSGSISALAFASESASAKGIDVNGAVGGSVSNSGAITAEATGFSAHAEATGVELGPVLAGGAFDNLAAGSIAASAVGSSTFSVMARGVDIGGESSGSITNAGSISASASVSSAFGVQAQGLYVSSLDEGGTITNSGSISANSDAAFALFSEATGVYVGDFTDASIATTAGSSISATASNFTAAESGTNVFANAIGLRVDTSLQAGSSITSAGTITAEATGSNHVVATAAGISVGPSEFGTTPLLTGTLTNSGVVSASATGSSGASAAGIHVASNIVGPGALTNSGSVSATATGPDAVAAGIDIDGGLFDGATVASTAGSQISATANAPSSAYAAGIYVESTIDAESSLTNAGTITASATANGLSGTASANGIYLGQSLSGTVLSSGSINVSAGASESAYAAGLYVEDSVAAGATLTNSGSIVGSASATFDAYADGIVVNSALASALTNSASGNISVSANAFSSASAHGIVVGSVLGEGGSLTNAGRITASAGASYSSGYAEAVGVYVLNDVGGAVSNSGTINVSASSGDDGAEGLSLAAGIGVQGTVTSGASVVNAAGGVINVSAFGSSSAALGIGVSSVASGGSVINNGTITVASHAADLGFGLTGLSQLGAAGMGVAFLDAGATLVNNGTITANTDRGTGTGWGIFVNDGGTGEGLAAQVLNDGVINGNVFIDGNVSLTNTGLINLPVSTEATWDGSYVSGDYTQAAGGVLQINAFDYDRYGEILVLGTADLTGSGQFVLNAVPGHELLYAGTLDNVVYGDTALATGAMTVSDNIPLWQFDAVNDGEVGIDLVVSGDAENVVTSTGPSWAIGAASGIDSVVDGEYGEDMSDVIAELAQITSDEELAAAVAQFVPVLIGRSVDQANLSLSGLSTLVMNRMDTHRAMTEDASHDQNFWIRGFGTSGQQDDDSDYPGYDSESYGFVIGYDMAVGGAWNVGAAFGYAQPELELDESVLQHEIDSDAYQGALYGYWESESETFVDLMGVYGVNQNDSSRMIAFGDILRTAEADYDTTYWRLSGAVGHDFPLSDSVTLTPIASIAYTYVEDDSYTESGADDLNLNVESVDAESLITALDLRLAFEVMENGFLTAHVGGGYDSMTDDIVVGSTFVGGGDPWRTAGPEPEETMLRAGAGAEFSVSDAIDVHVNYEYENRDTWENNLVTATMRWTF